MGLSRQRDDLKMKILNLEREVEAYKAVGGVRKLSKAGRFALASPFTSKVEKKPLADMDSYDKENASVNISEGSGGISFTI